MANNDNSVTIEFIPAKLSLEDFLPKYEYILKGKEISDESKFMKQSLIGFLQLNQELVLQNSISNQDEYTKGFKQGIALCKLWLDSIYAKTNVPDKESLNTTN